MKDVKLLDRINGMMKYRLDYEPKWYAAINAYENNHFVGWSRQRGSLMKVPFRKRFFIQLPEIKKQADSFENLLLMSNPMFVIAPNDFSNDKDRNYARAQSMLLRQKYLDWETDNIIHHWVHNAILMPVSFLEIAVEDQWDSDKQKFIKSIVPRVGDAFDWIFDPHYSFDDNQMVVKILRKPIQDYKDSSLYNIPKDGMTRNVVRDFKEVWLNDKFGGRNETDEFETVTAFECHIKTTKLVDGMKVAGLQIKTIDMGGEIIRDDFYSDITFFPVVPLQLFSGNPYQPSHVDNLIPINRAIDLLVNRIEDWMLKFVKGAYLTRDGSDVIFSDENGSVTKYTGEKPEVMPTPEFPMSIMTFLDKLLSFSERYGVNALAMGGMQKGSNQRSAKQGEQAIKGAQAQQKTPIDNMFFAMKRVAEITLYFLSELTDEPTNETLNKSENQGGEDFETKKFIGEKYKDLYPDAVPIPQKVKKMHVEMEDSQTYSIEQKRSDLKELAMEWNKIADPFKKPLLNLYRTGNTDGIMADDSVDGTLLDNPEIKMLVAHKDFLPPEVQQSLSTLFDYLAKQSKGDASNGDGKPKVEAPKPPSPGQPPPPQPGAPPSGPPQPQPQQPQPPNPQQ